MNQHIFHLHALSALHVGTGQGVGTVDLPIARAKSSNLPLIPGSGIKGVLRDELNLDKDVANALFGPQNLDEAAFAGAIAVGDAHLLILPVRSFAGTVAFATCPFILQRYARDLGIKLTIPKIKKVEKEDYSQTTATTVLKVYGTKIALEDLDLNTETSGDANQWAEQIAKALYPNDEAWRNEFISRFVVLSDSLFSFLADTATEIRVRNRIDRDTRTVVAGALWSEENLPAETVLWGVIGVSNARKKDGATANELSAKLPTDETIIQIGGKHTVGRGLTRFLLSKKG